MKLASYVLAFLTCSLLGVQPASAVTADELASYLGVNSWRSVVDLPAESFIVQIYEFANGVVADHPLIDGETQWSKTPEAGTLVLTGPRDGKYQVTVKFSTGCTLTAVSKTPTFGSSFSESLPKIAEGDYVVFGEPLGGEIRPQTKDIRTFSKGFLLRVKKI